MANAKEIQSRMKSIRDTMKITGAMYMISSTKLQKARRELEETEPYFYSLQGMISRIIRHIPEMEHRYIADSQAEAESGAVNEASGVSEKMNEAAGVSGEPGEAGGVSGEPDEATGVSGESDEAAGVFRGKSRGFLVVTADKGMAGAYNHNVLKLAENELEKTEKFSLLVVGEVGRQYFHGKQIPVDEHFLYTAQNPTMDRAREIAARVLELYDSGKVQEMYMIYTYMPNAARTETGMVRLLPLEKSDFCNIHVPLDIYQEEFFFHPSPERVIDYIVPDYLAGYIYGALMESYCSEHQARMTAMKAAGDSAQEMLHGLSIAYNRVRQAAITQEITEIIGGARAQKKKKEKKRRQQAAQKQCGELLKGVRV